MIDGASSFRLDRLQRRSPYGTLAGYEMNWLVDLFGDPDRAGRIQPSPYQFNHRDRSSPGCKPVARRWRGRRCSSRRRHNARFAMFRDRRGQVRPELIAPAVRACPGKLHKGWRVSFRDVSPARNLGSRASAARADLPGSTPIAERRLGSNPHASSMLSSSPAASPGDCGAEVIGVARAPEAIAHRRERARPG